MRILFLFFLLICACDKDKSVFEPLPILETADPAKVEKALKAPAVVIAARKQIGVTLTYDPAYRKLDYPGGDVAQNTGVCTDVIIRALRVSRELDLQKLVHEDMKKAFEKYPKIWGLTRPDKNIDHRRVPNLQCYFSRMGFEVKSAFKAKDFLPGDIVTCLVGNRPHIMLVSNRTLDAVPLVIHNIGQGTKEDNSLLSFKITGHYRLHSKE